jgi:hypothetical protein
MQPFRATLALVLASTASALWAQESVVVLESNISRSYDCHGGNGTVNGNLNSLTFRNCAAVVVNGNQNTVDAGTVASLTAIGNGNKVSWTPGAEGRQPKIANLGTNNVISSKVSAEAPPARAAAPAPAGAAPGGPGASTATVNSGGVTATNGSNGSTTTINGSGLTASNGNSTVQIGANGITVGGAPRPAAAPAQAAPPATGGSLTINNNNVHQEADCSGGAATVGGNGNTLTLKNCSLITVNGNDNSVTALGAASLVLNGNQNQIQWTENADGSRPRVQDHGNGNRVARKP